MGLSLLHEVPFGGDADRKALCMVGLQIIAKVPPSPTPPAGDIFRFSSLRLKNEVRKAFFSIVIVWMPTSCLSLQIACGSVNTLTPSHINTLKHHFQNKCIVV